MEKTTTEHGIFTENTKTGQTAEQVYAEWLANKDKPAPQSEMEVLKEENEILKSKLQTTEHMSRETSQAQQELLELLIEMGVI